jgi:hypothetical protein
MYVMIVGCAGRQSADGIVAGDQPSSLVNAVTAR